MKDILKAALIAPTLLIGFVGGAQALTLTNTDNNSVTRFISPDGATVTELKPISLLSPSSFNTSSFNSSYGGQFGGYTINTGVSNGDQITVSTYDAGSPGAAANGLPVVGGQIVATYQNNILPIGTPHFVQFVNTNQPLGNATPPYLDPAPNDDNLPFYWTETERPTYQSGTNLSFFDFSKRTSDDLFGTSPKLDSITWEADLFYVQWDGGTEITVEGGINWGWESKSATKGTSAASFVNSSPSTAVVSGVGTSSFAWGSGQPSQLSFTPKPFNPKPNEVFSLGTLDYFNGTILSGTEASSVDLLLDFTFDNAMENNQQISAGLSLINTVNTSDPVASADSVSFTSGGFTSAFNVLEGQSASAELFAKFISGTVTPSGAPNNSGKSLASPLDFPAISSLSIEILGFGNPSEFGFIEGDDFSEDSLPQSVPEPMTIVGTIAAFSFGVVSHKRKRK
ncbi:MAG: PEP-CTERM sorting domain-containing protein [Symploca sp. SIO2C1]|nr:PEP-CTERM sorting domain-containing protein [Symploca sp. SIO2C1]